MQQMYLFTIAVFWVVPPWSSERARRFRGTLLIFRADKETSRSSSAQFATSFSWFLAWLTLQPCRWRRYAPPKHRALSHLSGHTTREIVFCIVTAVNASNPVYSVAIVAYITTDANSMSTYRLGVCFARVSISWHEETQDRAGLSRSRTKVLPNSNYPLPLSLSLSRASFSSTPHDGGSRLHQNSGKHAADRMTSHPW
jgi:hypothetical protein